MPSAESNLGGGKPRLPAPSRPTALRPAGHPCPRRPWRASARPLAPPGSRWHAAGKPRCVPLLSVRRARGGRCHRAGVADIAIDPRNADQCWMVLGHPWPQHHPTRRGQAKVARAEPADCFTAGGASMPPAALAGLRPPARTSGLALARSGQTALRAIALRATSSGWPVSWSRRRKPAQPGGRSADFSERAEAMDGRSERPAT
jgi:hypothetical protein